MSKTLIPFLQALNHIKTFSTSLASCINLVGRNYLKPNNLSSVEIKSVMWTALDLKQLFRKCSEVDNIKSARITLLMHKPCMKIQGPAKSAATLLKLHLNVVIDPVWDKQEFINDIGSFFSTCSDMIFCQSQYQTKIEKFAEGSAIPVVCIKTCTYALLDTLADLMAIQEKYGHLKDLNLGWVGLPCPLINTYLCVAPKFGINIQYCCACACGAAMSPSTLPLGQEISKQKHTFLKECANSKIAIDKAHVVAMSKHQVREYNMNLKHILQYADKNWSFLHKLPRGTIEVDSEVFEHKNSLVWEAKGNLQWIYAALMLRFLSQYEHISKQPDFDGGKCSLKTC